MDALTFFLIAVGIFFLIIALPTRRYLEQRFKEDAARRQGLHRLQLQAFHEQLFPTQRQQILEDIIAQTRTIGHQRGIVKMSARMYDALPGFVYLMSMNDEHYKIGYARDVTKRLHAIQSSSPYKIVVEHIIATHHAPRLEATLHARYMHKHVNGEWFALMPEDIADIRAMGSPITVADLDQMELYP